MRWRHERGLSQRDAAKLAGLSQPAWQAYESGGLPRTPAAVVVERITEGAVKVTDWVESEERRAVRRARAATKRVPADAKSETRLDDEVDDASLHGRAS